LEVKYQKIADSLEESSKSYELSALIYADSLFYGLYDYGFKLQKSGVANINSAIKTLLLENTKASLRRSKLGLANANFTLLPPGFYNSEQIDELLAHSNNDLSEDTHLFRSDSIENFDIRIGYAVKKDLVKKLNTTFDSPILVHYMTAFLTNIDINHVNSEYQLHSCIYGDYQALALCKGSKLIWANHYKAPTPPLQLYNIAICAQLHHIDPSDISIHLSGWIDDNHGTVHLLKQYFKQITFDRNETSFNGQDIDDVQYYHPLVAISKCA
jgi:hypothetical protein